MNRQYYSGLPYSDELRHYGIIGMKWGVRRYQNKDGTRTEAGKLRYRTSNADENDSKDKTPVGSMPNVVQGAARGLGKGANRLGQGIARGVKEKLAEKFPFMLNDEELQKYTDRLRAENAYRNTIGDKRIAKRKGKTESFISDVAKQTVRNAANIATNRAMNKVMDRALENQNEKAYRKAKEMSNIEAETEKATINSINNTLRENEANNLFDVARKADINVKVNKLNKAISEKEDKINRLRLDTSMNDVVKKAMISEIKIENAARRKELSDLNKEYNKLTNDINNRRTKLKEMNKALTDQGYSMYKQFNNKNNNQNSVSDIFGSKTFKAKRKKH